MNDFLNYHWDFPASNHTDVHGFDTPDMETFKKDPIAGIARESVQNSIDAKRPGAVGPVRIEFISSEIGVNDICRIEEIENQLVHCEKKRQGSNKDLEKIEQMRETLKAGKLKVLRISDHNTTGLTGIASGDDDDRWGSLIKGSANSNKGTGTLGSKGIGKFAAFVCSRLRMVFYSTFNMDGERGYEGVCRLCAATIDGSTDYTIGPGYFASGIEHKAITSDIPESWSLKRGADDYGTDVYIIGFTENEGWEKDVISNVLESFIVAISQGQLIVQVNNLEINANNLAKIVSDPRYISLDRSKSILSQYDCLANSDSVLVKEIDLDDFDGQLELRVKKYVAGSEEEKRATKCCTMLRWPFMRIRDKKNISVIPCSSLLLIKNGPLADMLRDIENPQHNDWEPKRIEDPRRQKYVSGVIKEMERKIIEAIKEFLKESNTDETDFDGAGEFLPDISGTDGTKKKIKDDTDVQSLGREKQSIATTTEGYEPSSEAQTVEPDVGSVDEEEEGEASVPSGENNGEGGGPRPGEGGGAVEPGDKEIFRRVKLASLHYRFFCIDKAKGQYCIYVVAPTDDENCEMEIYSCDDAGGKEKIRVLQCQLNGANIEFEENVVKGYKFVNGQAYRFMVMLETTELISGRVEFYADRK